MACMFLRMLWWPCETVGVQPSAMRFAMEQPVAVPARQQRTSRIWGRTAMACRTLEMQASPLSPLPAAWHAAPADAASVSANALSAAAALRPRMPMLRVLGRRCASSAGPLMRATPWHAHQ